MLDCYAIRLRFRCQGCKQVRGVGRLTGKARCACGAATRLRATWRDVFAAAFTDGEITAQARELTARRGVEAWGTVAVGPPRCERCSHVFGDYAAFENKGGLRCDSCTNRVRLREADGIARELHPGARYIVGEASGEDRAEEPDTVDVLYVVVDTRLRKKGRAKRRDLRLHSPTDTPEPAGAGPHPPAAARRPVTVSPAAFVVALVLALALAAFAAVVWRDPTAAIAAGAFPTGLVLGELAGLAAMTALGSWLASATASTATASGISGIVALVAASTIALHACAAVTATTLWAAIAPIGLVGVGGVILHGSQRAVDALGAQPDAAPERLSTFAALATRWRFARYAVLALVAASAVVGIVLLTEPIERAPLAPSVSPAFPTWPPLSPRVLPGERL